MRYAFSRRKKIAIGLLTIWGINLSMPAISYALTSGPVQPETKGFQVAGVSDMVDLQSGELKYNIPLMDIDGYPLNLSYQSGVGIDDEASWVGLGWSLNPGAINRQVRGIPDDFSGDLVETDHYTKPKVTVGGRLTAKVEYAGIAKVSGSFSFGIFSDNYSGIGAELGANAGISYSIANSGTLTAGLGAGVLSNTQSGVDASLSPYVSLSIRESATDNMTVDAGLSASYGYNTRSGLKSRTLGSSFGTSNYQGNDDPNPGHGGQSNNLYGSTISYNTEPISPSIQVPYLSKYGSFSFDVGLEGWSIFGSLGGTGYQSVRSVKSIYNPKPAFGFLYAERGKNNKDAVMDFTREKDNPIIPELPDIAIPIHTPDIWSYSSQSGSGQFRLYRGGSGSFFDNQAADSSAVSTIGGDLGIGSWVHGGITNYNQAAKTTTRKWTNNNNYVTKGDFQNPSFTNPNQEHVYFKQVGEKTIGDKDMAALLKDTDALEVDIQGMSSTASLRKLGNLHKTPADIVLSSPITKATRQPNRTVISYLTASEASQAGLNKTIQSYAFNDIGGYTPLTAEPIVDKTFPRVDFPQSTDAVHKPHHISELTVTDDGGKKMVYGIPVYNINQDEYSFAIDPTTWDNTTNLVGVPSTMSAGGVANPMGASFGIDNYYHKDHKPAYASSYLLTAVLSPDYVDKTGDGITDDDLGTAIKFNYSKLPYSYKWRSPYVSATANRGLLADPDDDKGSIVYGEKEVWYVHSIESKTKIAYFITENRRDALGTNNWFNGGVDNMNAQKRLREIRLYSKADMTKPIKVVKFSYTYELCKGIPNSADFGSTDPSLSGKLTLSSVWFEYGNSTKGDFHPYVFHYNEATSHYSNPQYGYSLTDRWGVYKPSSENLKGLTNEQYPYTNQNADYTSGNAALWHLNQVNLPTGGIINISYESGDYAYVQDKKAMVMTPIASLLPDSLMATSIDTTRALNTAVKGLRIIIPPGITPPHNVDPTTWFKNTFLDGSDYLYTKLCVNMSTPNSHGANNLPYDYVPTYCLVQSVTIKSGVANVMFTPISTGSVTASPLCMSAWQRLKNEYPRYAYPGFDNRVQSENSSVLGAVSAIVNAAKNLTELKQSFYQKASSRGYASKVILSQSFAKVTQVSGFKLGGSCRVKKIQISDTWNTINSSYSAATYGQSYSYTTTENGNTISSGVASYEPAVGNDENALKQPVPYIENVKGAINNYFDIEKPFCESLYPAPGVGYSKVTVNDLDKAGNPSTKTGNVVSEFYTSKDYPVKVTVLPLIPDRQTPSNHYSLVSSNTDDELALSQGYSIQLNDMNGKQKATSVYDMSGALISSTAYYYKSETDGAGIQLNNIVDVVDPTTLKVSPQVLGRDMDFFTDFREQETSNKGKTVNIGADVFPILPWLPFFVLPHLPINTNNDYKLFRSACALKVIQNYGILTKTVKTENGSSITTENLAFDGLTGEAIVTRTKNEFKKDIYSVNIPAYWAYKGMGAAYQDLGVLFSAVSTNTNGEISSAFTTYLQAGDEILDTNDGNHYWVIENQAATGGSGTTKKLIDRTGVLKASYSAVSLVKIVKSGYNNMLGASTSTLVMLNTPFIVDGGGNKYLQLTSSGDLTALKVINASATTFDESWAVSNNCSAQQVPDPTLNVVKNTSRDFSVSTASPLAEGLEIQDYFSSSNQYVQSSYWGGVGTNTGRLGVIGFWPTEASSHTYNTRDYFGFDAVVNFPQSKVYYFVMAGVDTCTFSVDCDNQKEIFESIDAAQWYNAIGKSISAGKHIIHCSYKLKIGSLHRTAGLEVYNNTYNELVNANSIGTGLNIVFSTKNFVGNNGLYDFFDQDGWSYTDQYESGLQSYHFTKPDGSPPFYNFSYICPTTISTIVNPYVIGFLGNWRPYQTNVFQQSRNYAFANNLTSPSIDVKNAGYINSFYSYWFLITSGVWTVNPIVASSTNKWITANTVTLYDKYGQQLENMDALGRFSAANFDFNGELPAVVASNAMNQEIYAASLEDSRFSPGSSTTAKCNLREFTQLSTGQTIKQLAVNTFAHSGNYSTLLPSDGVTMNTIIKSIQQKSTGYLGLDAQKQYNLLTTTGLYPNGFEPYPGKKYIFDAWVNDGAATDKSVNITLTINTNNVPLTCKAVVEGWKLLEGTIDLSTLGSATSLNIAIKPTGSYSVYIDDIRMHPFDAQMKTYAYDDKTMRLMAELDENGFATFYEYDDEGLLIRVKKETEKGIMTLKESRSTYRKITP